MCHRTRTGVQVERCSCPPCSHRMENGVATWLRTTLSVSWNGLPSCSYSASTHQAYANPQNRHKSPGIDHQRLRAPHTQWLPVRMSPTSDKPTVHQSNLPPSTRKRHRLCQLAWCAFHQIASIPAATALSIKPSAGNSGGHNLRHSTGRVIPTAPTKHDLGQGRGVLTTFRKSRPVGALQWVAWPKGYRTSRAGLTCHSSGRGLSGGNSDGCG